MIDKEKLIKTLEDKLSNGITNINVQNLINELKDGRYDIKHLDVSKYYKDNEDDEDVWCK